MESEGADVFFRQVPCSGRTLKVKQLCVGDTGSVVWDAALVLCRFLENERYFPGAYWSGRSVVELGSGTGVVGLAAGTLKAEVIVTDLPECLPLMSSNIELNKDAITGHVTARALVWGEEVTGIAQSPSVILMSDVVYYREALAGLVKTLVDLSDHETLIVMTYEQRTTGEKPEIERSFFQLMGQHFSHTAVPLSDQDPDLRSSDIHIILFRKLKSV